MGIAGIIETILYSLTRSRNGMYISTSRWSADAVTRHYPDSIVDATVGSHARRHGCSKITAVQHHLEPFTDYSIPRKKCTNSVIASDGRVVLQVVVAERQVVFALKFEQNNKSSYYFLSLFMEAIFERVMT